MVENMGYVKVNRFAATTYDDLTEVSCASRGMKKLILDLRDNAGGYLEQAYRMVDELLPEGKKIVYTKGRRPEFDDEFLSTGRQVPGGHARRPCEQWFGVRERDRGRRGSGLGPGPDRRRNHVRQGARAAPVRPERRVGVPSDHGPLLYAQRPADPAAVRTGQEKYQREAYTREESEGENVEHNAERIPPARCSRPWVVGSCTAAAGSRRTTSSSRTASHDTAQLRGKQVFFQMPTRMSTPAVRNCGRRTARTAGSLRVHRRDGHARRDQGARSEERREENKELYVGPPLHRCVHQGDHREVRCGAMRGFQGHAERGFTVQEGPVASRRPRRLRLACPASRNLTRG